MECGSIEKVREYMKTGEYTSETSRAHVLQLILPLVSKAIEEVANLGDKASSVAIEIAAIALARISFGKDGEIPFGILLTKDDKSVKAQIVSDPYYKYDSKVVNGAVGDIYHKLGSEITEQSFSKEESISVFNRDYQDTSFSPKRDVNKSGNMGNCLSSSTLNTSTPGNIDGFARYMKAIPEGTVYIYGHDAMGGRFHMKTISTPKFSYKHNPSSQKKSP